MKKLLLPLAGGICLTAAVQAQTLNEIRIDNSGTDTDEYFEIAGPPGMLLDGLTYIVIGDATGDLIGGGIEMALDLTGIMIQPDGLVVVGESTMTLTTPDFVASMNFENGDNVTHMLVTGWSGAIGDDIDLNDDGVIDTPAPWTAIIDSIGFVSPSDPSLLYGPNTIGPDGTFVPAHIKICGGAWAIGQFGFADDTPGDANDCRVIETFCDPATANSTTFPAELSGSWGSGVGSDLHLEVTGGPAGEFGFFIVGDAPEASGVNPISNGFLCLSIIGGNAVARHNVDMTDLNSIGQFDAGGVLVNMVGTATSSGGTGYDVAAMSPIPGAGTILAGQTWHYQVWYRDTPAGAGSSNLSNGLSATF